MWFQRTLRFPNRIIFEYTRIVQSFQKKFPAVGIRKQFLPDCTVSINKFRFIQLFIELRIENSKIWSLAAWLGI